MDGRTIGTNWYGTVRGMNFWYEILFGTVNVTWYEISYQKSYYVPYQVRVHTKISTTYCSDKNPEQKSVPRTKIRTSLDCRYGTAVHSSI